MLYGITIIFAALFLGEALCILLHLPLPGSVLGMLLLLLAALIKRGFDLRVVEVSNHLLRYMALLFIPAGVGLMTLGDLLGQQGLALLLTMVFSTVVTMAVTGLVLQWLLRRQRRNKDAP
ncbi:CidA/LrgA family protein [Chitinibacter sp. SCUT-21]|uniref:CidA/LrgA family protein n=1 Tax=Chitinibacter sp. SCUT-21 TaxID=2970891 RepID=UPI0035A6BC89